jgi:hypothetical protein
MQLQEQFHGVPVLAIGRARKIEPLLGATA